ncbi:hypothetical protein [Streptomyces chilikensis]|uniref:DNA primase/polymerase bifunctional N-terminal domain-containing protein n=1 Tax=Streptomyces chilikensis TaxID=1194079 RepID=A0ABV3EJH4_9ACTN
MTVTTGAERRLASRHWLLAAAPDRSTACQEWQSQGVALLRTGGIFAAARLSGRLVRAAAQADDHDGVDSYLREVLDGPVFHDRRGDRYYALVPSSTATAWPTCPDTDVLGRDTFVGIPDVTATEPTDTTACYWCVPVESAGTLCDPSLVAQVAAAGLRRLADEAQTPTAKPTP